MLCRTIITAKKLMHLCGQRPPMGVANWPDAATGEHLVQKNRRILLWKTADNRVLVTIANPLARPVHYLILSDDRTAGGWFIVRRLKVRTISAGALQRLGDANRKDAIDSIDARMHRLVLG